MAKVEFQSRDGQFNRMRLDGPVHAVVNVDGVRLTGTDDQLQQLVGIRNFVIVPDEQGKVYLKNEQGVGADIDRWTATNVPTIGVAVITKK